MITRAQVQSNKSKLASAKEELLSVAEDLHVRFLGSARLLICQERKLLLRKREKEVHEKGIEVERQRRDLEKRAKEISNKEEELRKRGSSLNMDSGDSSLIDQIVEETLKSVIASKEGHRLELANRENDVIVKNLNDALAQLTKENRRLHVSVKDATTHNKLHRDTVRLYVPLEVTFF